MNTIDNNPYVGLRTFRKDEGHLFFGRDRETSDLTALVATERLVLFYAQSGAGKSSLVNTRLIPDLENNRFEVFPVGRVSGEVPADLHIGNVYIYNLIRSLIQHEIDPRSVAKLSLSQFMIQLNKDSQGYFYDSNIPVSAKEVYPPGRRALIIDQFEEIFSTHLEAWKVRGDFFKQLAKAMQDDPHLWVVLTMREDYIAALDPYSHLLPGRLRARYYIQRLEGDAALEAVKGPVQSRRPFAEGVAEKLVEDLSRNQINKPGGKLEYVIGQFVEPIVLQVVCHGLWENLPEAGEQITEHELDELGDVNEALERYYGERISSAAHDHHDLERQIRQWFENELLTSGNTRNMVLRDSITNAGLYDAIQSLQGNLIRAEIRAGQTWYELSHDRLIEPVRTNNADWFEKNLSLFQRQASLWMQQGRSEGLLLRGRELEMAEKEAETMTLTSSEKAYLDSCRALKIREQRDLRQRSTIRVALIVSVIFLIAAVIFGVGANRAEQRARVEAENARKAKQDAEMALTVADDLAKSEFDARKQAEEEKENADKERNNALSGSLAAQADSLKSSDHTLALLLGMEAYLRGDSLLTRTTLFQLLQFSPYTRLFGFNGPVTSAAVSPDGRLIAASSCREGENGPCDNGSLRLFDAETNKLEVEIPGAYGIVYSLAFNKDGSVLVAGGCVPLSGRYHGCADNKGQITFWSVDSENPSQTSLLYDTLVSYPEIHTNLVKTIALSPDDDILASGSYDKTIMLWDVTNKNNPKPVVEPLRGHSSFVNGLVFHPNDKILVSAGDDKTILIYDYSILEKPKLVWRISEGHSAPINSIAFSPDGNLLASAGDDNTVILWDWDSKSFILQKHALLRGHSGYVKSVAFSEDGTLLASAGYDNKVLLWTIGEDKIEQNGLSLEVHSKAINAIAFGKLQTPSGKVLPYLVSGSSDRTAVNWELATRRALSKPIANSPPEPKLRDFHGPFEAVIDGTRIFLSNNNEPDIPDNNTLVHNGQVNSVAFSPPFFPDGAPLLASASDDQTVVLWRVRQDVLMSGKFLIIEGFDSPVLNVYFSEDGKKLITLDKNGQSVEWTIDPSNWVSLACDAINGNLTTEQWNLFLPYLPDQVPIETCVMHP